MHVLVHGGVEPAVALQQHARADHDDAAVLGDADGAGGVDIVEGQRGDQRELGRIVEDLEANRMLREHADLLAERGAGIGHRGEQVRGEQRVAGVGEYDLDVTVGAALTQGRAERPLLAAREAEVVLRLLGERAGGGQLTRGQGSAQQRLGGRVLGAKQCKYAGLDVARGARLSVFKWEFGRAGEYGVAR